MAKALVPLISLSEELRVETYVLRPMVAVYRVEFDLLYRREATHTNAMCQADNVPLVVVLLGEAGKPAQALVNDDRGSRTVYRSDKVELSRNRSFLGAPFSAEI